MFQSIADPDDRPLPGAPPVGIVTFQLDFEEERKLAPKDGVAWQRLLNDRGLHLPRLSQVKQQNFAVDVLGQRQLITGERSGWQVFLDDKVSNLCLYSTAVSLERYGYTGFESFRKECMMAFDALAELLAPTVQTKLSLRYANALSDPKAEKLSFWRGKVRPHFLGPPADEHLVLDYDQGLSMFRFVNGALKADIRVGTQPDQVHRGCQAVVWQTEVYEELVKELSRENFEQTLDELHNMALKLFYEVLTPEYAKELREAV